MTGQRLPAVAARFPRPTSPPSVASEIPSVAAATVPSAKAPSSRELLFFFPTRDGFPSSLTRGSLSLPTTARSLTFSESAVVVGSRYGQDFAEGSSLSMPYLSHPLSLYKGTEGSPRSCTGKTELPLLGFPSFWPLFLLGLTHFQWVWNRDVTTSIGRFSPSLSFII